MNFCPQELLKFRFFLSIVPWRLERVSNMANPIGTAVHSEPAAPNNPAANAPSGKVNTAAAPKPTPSAIESAAKPPTDTVQISSGAQSALKNAANQVQAKVPSKADLQGQNAISQSATKPSA